MAKRKAAKPKKVVKKQPARPSLEVALDVVKNNLPIDGNVAVIISRNGLKVAADSITEKLLVQPVELRQALHFLGGVQGYGEKEVNKQKREEINSRIEKATAVARAVMEG